MNSEKMHEKLGRWRMRGGRADGCWLLWRRAASDLWTLGENSPTPPSPPPFATPFTGHKHYLFCQGKKMKAFLVIDKSSAMIGNRTAMPAVVILMSPIGDGNFAHWWPAALVLLLNSQSILSSEYFVGDIGVRCGTSTSSPITVKVGSPR